MADLPFLDALQKKFGRALGYFPTKQFEGYIEGGHVLVAEGQGARGEGREEANAGTAAPFSSSSSLAPDPLPLAPLGYVISRDRYLKRDELGVVYQLCVAPGHQRGLIGATLVREVFARSAYGCKLYCCWCAQDLAANHFWESMGFVPIAFRAGSTGKRRVHIFWQRRINDGDTATPYWYPSMTNQGAIREDRLVFPIPPGTHWSEVQAVAVPHREKPALARPKEKPQPQPKAKVAPPKVQTTTAFGLRFAAPSPARAPRPKRERSEKPKARIDPQLIAKARELRDRYLEHVNSEPHALRAIGKYEVSRLPDPTRDAKPIAMLPAA
jgi:ribosomal protein S18 acetylase RimI-like enzyme